MTQTVNRLTAYNFDCTVTEMSGTFCYHKTNTSYQSPTQSMCKATTMPTITGKLPKICLVKMSQLKAQNTNSSVLNGILLVTVGHTPSYHVMKKVEIVRSVCGGKPLVETDNFFFFFFASSHQTPNKTRFHGVSA